jgi:hypothetical protein
MTAIANITLQQPNSAVLFSGIPQTYKDLIITVNWENSGNSSASRIQLNGDTGSNYNGVWMTGFGNGSFATSNESNQTSSRAAGASVGPVNSFTNIMSIYFIDYSSTDKHKTYLVRYGSGFSEAQATVSRWANTAAIQSIRIFDIVGQNFMPGATFTLYGRVG